MKIGGLQYWAAADGNTVIDDPAVSSVVIRSMGSTGPVDPGGGGDNRGGR